MEILRLALAALGWLLAAGALIASLAAHGGRFSARLDVLTHFAPIWLASALVALALSGGGPRTGRAALAATAAIGVLAAAALMAPEFVGAAAQPRAPATAPDQFKVVQFNAWGGNARAEAAVDWLIAQAPDVILLEEGGQLRDRLVARGYHASCARCSTVVLSRAVPERVLVEQPGDGQPAFIASATFRDDRGEFTVVAVHRYWPVRLDLHAAQTARLEARLADLPKTRLILAGDFNSTPWSFARRREDRDFGLIRRTRALFSWPAARVSHNRLPAPFPYMPIDHVYAGPGWATVSVERGPELGSDHYPVAVTLAPASTGRASAVHGG